MPSVLATTVLHCPGCASEQVFEQPTCSDGHDERCPDWACTTCGFALVTGFVPEPARSPLRQPSAA